MVFILFRRMVEVNLFFFQQAVNVSFLKCAQREKKKLKAVLQFTETLPQGVIWSVIPYIIPMKFTICLNLRKEKVSVLYFLMRTSVIPLN